MAGEAEQVDAEVVDVHGDLAAGLHGVRLEERPGLARDRGQLRDRLNRADLVVRHHDRHELRLRPHRRAQSVGYDQAFGVDGKVGHIGADLLEESARAQYGGVFDLSGHQVSPTVGKSLGDAHDRGIVRFGSAAREHDLLGIGTEQGRKDGDLLQRLLTDICNGQNFDWRYTTEPNDAYFNKRVIEEWCKSWTRCKDDEKFWLWFAKLEDEKPAGEAGNEESSSGGSKSRLKALDALNDDDE